MKYVFDWRKQSRQQAAGKSFVVASVERWEKKGAVQGARGKVRTRFIGVACCRRADSSLKSFYGEIFGQAQDGKRRKVFVSRLNQR